MITLTTLVLVIVPATMPLQQTDTTQLEPITITATRVPVSARVLTSSLTVIDGNDLRLRGVTSVADALRDVPGATVVQSGSFGGATSLFLRGGESDYVQVLIDGVKVNQPGGAYDFAHLSTANIERIEILRGPGSVLYGADAIAGVVQIFTRQGSGAARYNVGVRGGTFGSVRVDGDVSGETGGVQYAFGASHLTTDGVYAFNNDYDNTVWSGRVQLKPDNVSTLTLSMRYRDSRFHFPTDASGNLVDQNALSLDEATSVSIDAARWLANNVEVRLLVASNVTSIGTDDAQDNDADTTGFYAFQSLQDLRRQSADLRANVFFDPGIVVTGGVELERHDERSFNESLSQFGPSNGSTKEDRNNRSAYAQVLLNHGGVSVTGGARVDDNSAFGTFWTYRGGVGYQFSTGTSLRGSVGRSFKAPTFFENFATGFVTGNPELSPERSTTWEASVTQSILGDLVSVTGTYFVQSFRDLIQFTFDQSPNYANIAEADASGLEIETVVHVPAGLSLTANYSYLDTEVKDAGFQVGEGASFVLGNRLLRRPTDRVTASVDYTGLERAGLGIGVVYMGDRDDRDFSTFPAMPVILRSATTVNVWGTVDLVPQRGVVPGLSATLRIENVFNESYETIVGFPARGRTVFLGGRIHGGQGR